MASFRTLQRLPRLLKTVSRRTSTSPSASQGPPRQPYVEPLLPKHTWKATKFIVGIVIFGYIMYKPEWLDKRVSEFWIKYVFEDPEMQKHRLEEHLLWEQEKRRRFLERKRREMVPFQPMYPILEAESIPAEKRESSFHNTV